MCRYSTSSPAQRVAWAIRVRKGFRLPQNIAQRWHGQKPIATEFAFPGLRAADVSEGSCQSMPAPAQIELRLISFSQLVSMLDTCYVFIQTSKPHNLKVRPFCVLFSL